MATTGKFSYEYASDVNSVFSLLKDPEFLKRRGEAAGDKNVEISISEQTDGLHLTIARDRTLDLPDIVKGIVKPTNRAVERTTWRPAPGGGYVAKYELEVAGFPGTLRGESKLSEQGGRTKYDSTFEVNSRIPLVGRKIESLIVEGFVEQLALNAERNAAELDKED